PQDWQFWLLASFKDGSQNCQPAVPSRFWLLGFWLLSPLRPHFPPEQVMDKPAEDSGIPHGVLQSIRQPGVTVRNIHASPNAKVAGDFEQRLLRKPIQQFEFTRCFSLFQTTQRKTRHHG